jgi:hypothetical protein
MKASLNRIAATAIGGIGIEGGVAGRTSGGSGALGIVGGTGGSGGSGGVFKAEPMSQEPTPWEKAMSDGMPRLKFAKPIKKGKMALGKGRGWSCLPANLIRYVDYSDSYLMLSVCFCLSAAQVEIGSLQMPQEMEHG